MNPHIHQITTTDAHVSGEPIRVMSSEILDLQGSSITEKRDYFSSRLDYLRKALILEPRGHENMFGAVACPPQTEDGDFGLFFMDTAGYLNMCGHGTIGSVTILLEKKMIFPRYDSLTIETPSGLIRARYRMEENRVTRVSFTNVPAFVYQAGVSICTPSFGDIKADIVFSGNFFIMIDICQIPLGLTNDHLSDLVSEAMQIKKDLNRRLNVRHPLGSHISGMDLVQFYDLGRTGSPKNCVIFGKGQVDRSPCGTGLSGLLALMSHKNQLAVEEPITCQSILGTTFEGKITKKTSVGPYDAIIPEISGTAHITGTHEFILTRDDPFKHGFLLQ